MTCRTTSRTLHKWHRELNSTVFGGELERPVIVFGFLGDGTLGLCYGKRIMISTGLQYMPNECKATLLHEMVHQWQAQNELDMDHSTTFKQWIARCRDIAGLEIV